MSNFTFFYRAQSPFSHWHPCVFTVNGDTFYCAEQFMMHGKALLFGDAEIAAQILRTKSPGAQKALGRKVANFNDLTWKANRLAIVYLADID